MAFNLFRHMEISARDLECAHIGIHNNDFHPGPVQHGRQGATAAADHQNLATFYLPEETENRMNIVGQADAIAVRDTVIKLLFPEGHAACRVVLFDGQNAGNRSFHASSRFM
jgi:hypothetical protein